MSKVDINKLRSFAGTQNYPTSKENLRSSASNQQLDEEIVTLLAEIPDTTYSTEDEVIHAVREIETEFQTGVWRTRGPNK